MRKPCAFGATPNHSNDRVKVYCGSLRPVVLCGYHASDAWLPVALAHVSNNNERK